MTAAQLDLLAQLETMTDDQVTQETPQGRQEAPEANLADLVDLSDLVVA